MRPIRFAFVLTAALTWVGPLSAQPKSGGNVGAEFTRTNPKFLAAFKECVAESKQSTVRVLCDGKDTALGMVVDSDGWILTKANDLHGIVSVRLPGGKGTLEAKVVGWHQAHDLAMLKVVAKDLPAVSFHESKEVLAGSWVACAGLESEPVAIGVISVPARSVKTGKIPTADPAKAAYMGFMLQPTGDGIGVKIQEVVPNTPAAKAGLKVNDVILEFGGKKTNGPDQFMENIARYKPGDVVGFRFLRDGAEQERKATLERRPLGSFRGEMQNRMGSELSARRSGYPSILQHDSVVKPVDCGGPIVDLDGRVIGINICRAGRTESWAVPAETLKPLLADLKSGKLAPPKPVLAGFAADRVLVLMRERLVAMNDVAAWKWNHRQEISDPAREKQILNAIRDKAVGRKLDPNDAEAFFKAQIAAAKVLQQERMGVWQKDNVLAPAKADLNADLRPKLDRTADDLLAAWANLAPYVRDADAKVEDHVRSRMGQSLAGPGISDAVREAAIAAFAKR